MSAVQAIIKGRDHSEKFDMKDHLKMSKENIKGNNWIFFFLEFFQHSKIVFYQIMSWSVLT